MYFAVIKLGDAQIRVSQTCGDISGLEVVVGALPRVESLAVIKPWRRANWTSDRIRATLKQ
jgi:hypothetical protein